MKKPSKPEQGATHVIGASDGKRSAADMDDLHTTVRGVVAGRLVVTDGPGKGERRDFYRGSNSIGRDAARNVIALDIGDASIHREQHAFLTSKDGAFTLHDNGKKNPVKINGKMLEGTQSVTPADVIEIGMTKVRIELA
jgi:hypothetical protein